MSAPNMEWFLLGCNADCLDVDQENNPAAQKTKSFLCQHYKLNCLLTRLVATANNCLSSRTPAIVGRLVFSPVPPCVDRHL
jgi:hypothetical protein